MDIIHICGGCQPTYRFDGWLFEIHNYVGPYPLNKDGEPRSNPPGSKFWRMWAKFEALTKEQKDSYKV